MSRRLEQTASFAGGLGRWAHLKIDNVQGHETKGETTHDTTDQDEAYANDRVYEFF